MNISPQDPELLRISGVTKRFGSARALSDISFGVFGGEVHGLIGQNGAGKSTLMAVASGALVPDAGSVTIGGHAAVGDPELSRELGLAIVRQEPALMLDLSVAENLYLGVSKERRPPIPELNAWATGLLERWEHGLGFQSTDRVNTLSAEHRFIVEIVKALANVPRVLVLDEPTEHLRGGDVTRLFDRIRAIAGKGAGVVYISHRIRDVRMIADRVTVLRDGVSQGTYQVEGLSEKKIVELIVGKTLEQEFPAKAEQARSRGSVVLRASRLSGVGFSDVSLEVRRGEILGLAGIDGNGQREFMRAIAGLTKSHGSVAVLGEPVSLRTPHHASVNGIQYVTGDRHREGVFGELPIRANSSLRSLVLDSVGGLVLQSKEAPRALRQTSALAVKMGSIEDPIRFLSGGNQQKVVIGSALAAAPKLLLVDQPTQGVDIGSRAEIYRILRDTADGGTGVVVVSSDAAELAGLCNRVLTFSRGTVGKELAGDSVNENEIVAALLTTTSERDRTAHGMQDGLRRFWQLLATDWAPVALVALAALLLAGFGALSNDTYLSSRNLSGMLALVATLTLAACGQQILMLVGGIDLSVGPLMGLIVVVQSFFLSGEPTSTSFLASAALLVAVALAVGLVNWILVDPVGMHPMVATLSTFMALQAISLLLRPTADGLINEGVMDAVNMQWGPFLPLAMAAAIVLALFLDYGLFRRAFGIALRGFGSQPDAARVAGISPRRTRLLAYIGCSLVCGLGAIPLMGQVGIGDPRAGIDYTLTSIAAVVIGGGSLFGARGSFVGALCGALLIAQVNVVSMFMGLSESWRSYLLGLMILGAVALHSKSRQLVLAK